MIAPRNEIVHRSPSCSSGRILRRSSSICLTVSAFHSRVLSCTHHDRHERDKDSQHDTEAASDQGNNKIEQAHLRFEHAIDARRVPLAVISNALWRVQIDRLRTANKVRQEPGTTLQSADLERSHERPSQRKPWYSKT
jgi:hypothetical protein